MDEYVTTKDADKIKKVGLSQHRIAQLARHQKIVAHRAGVKKWLVKVTLNNGKYELVKCAGPGEEPIAEIKSGGSGGLPKVTGIPIGVVTGIPIAPLSVQRPG